MNMSTSALVSIIAAGILGSLTFFVNNTSTEQNEANTQFECGFNLINTSATAFSFQFFLISLLFLIFDIEVALLISFPLEPTSTNNLTVILAFLGTVSIGLFYEWQKGNISWSN